MEYSVDRSKDEAADEEYEYLAFELPDVYLRRMKKECIDKNITLNQMVVDIVGNAVKNWPEEPREDLKLIYKRVTVKVPKKIYNKLNARKEETTISIRSLAMFIIALHYFGPEKVYEGTFGDTLPLYPHVQETTS
jgi:hypothetical protein